MMKLIDNGDASFLSPYGIENEYISSSCMIKETSSVKEYIVYVGLRTIPQNEMVVHLPNTKEAGMCFVQLFDALRTHHPQLLRFNNIKIYAYREETKAIRYTAYADSFEILPVYIPLELN